MLLSSTFLYSFLFLMFDDIFRVLLFYLFKGLKIIIYFYLLVSKIRFLNFLTATKIPITSQNVVFLFAEQFLATYYFVIHRHVVFVFMNRLACVTPETIKSKQVGRSMNFFNENLFFVIYDICFNMFRYFCIYLICYLVYHPFISFMEEQQQQTWTLPAWIPL